MSDTRGQKACDHIRRGVETGHADEFSAAIALIRKLEQEARMDPRERERQARLETARKAEKALAGPAAAYSRYLKKQGRAA